MSLTNGSTKGRGVGGWVVVVKKPGFLQSDLRRLGVDMRADVDRGLGRVGVLGALEHLRGERMKQKKRVRHRERRA
jgi:hypothetical protein